MNTILWQKVVSTLFSGFWRLLDLMKTRIQIPLFVLIIPVAMALVYYFKFRNEKEQIQEIANTAISSNLDLRQKMATDSLEIVKLNNEKTQIINYHFAYLDTLCRMPRAKLQAELSRYYEK